MGGKASLILIFGLSFIFSVYQLKTGNVTTHAVDNSISYYEKTISHQIAVSGLNIAAAKLYEDYTWRGPLKDVSYSGGNFTINFGSVADPLTVTSHSNYMGVVDTVIAVFTGQNNYKHYTWFTAHENGVSWAPGDTVWGPVHTNSTLNHQNDASIVFYGKATAGKSISSPPKTAKTKFYGGYEVGVFLPEVTDMNKLIAAAGAGGYTFPFATDTMKMSFNADGTLDVYHNSALIHDDIPFSTLTPNGAIYSLGPIEVLGGTVNTPSGGVSIGSNDQFILRQGVQYADDPETNPNSDDLIAFISENNILVDNTVTTDWKMQAVMMAINGGLQAVNMAKNGKFDFYGSTYQNVRGNAKMFQSFQKKYKYDERLLKISPPYFPGFSSLKLISWWE
jgi:hypothetical protein